MVSRNIIAGNTKITGDCRGFNDLVSKTIEERMRALAAGLSISATDAGGQQEPSILVDYSNSFRPLVNDSVCTSVAVAAATAVGTTDANYGRVSFSEDFAEFLGHRPGAFVLMGNGIEGENAMPLHNPEYDFNDAAITSGIEYWKQIALSV